MAYDQEFDDFHKDERVANIYKLHAHSNTHQSILSPYGLGAAAASEVTGINRFTRYSFEKGLIVGENKGFIEGVGVADSTFFSMFEFPLVDGNLNSFKGEFEVVISKKLSEKLFGNEDPIQQPLFVKLGDREPVRFYVGAVIQDIPHNTSFTFDLMMRIEHYQKIKSIDHNSWSVWPAVSTFFEVNDKVTISDMNALFQKFINDHDLDIEKYSLEHFKADFTMTEIWGAMVNVRMWQTPIRILALMAFVLFMIACFNLSNTSFSLMAQRMNEIAVRRSLGASRYQIVLQFLLEISATILISMVIGLTIANSIVPAFADMWAQGIGNRWDTLVFRLEDINRVRYLISLLALVILGVSLAGVYPAIFFSKLKPVVLFAGDKKVGGTNLFSQFLLVFQFSISLVMLILGFTFVKNSNYMINAEAGFDKDQIVHVNTNDEIDLNDLQFAVSQIPGVTSSAWSKDHFGGVFTSKVTVDQREIIVRSYEVSEGYLDLVGIRLKEGRKLLKSDHKKAVVVTERFAEAAHFESPVGEVLRIGSQVHTIVGVVGNIVDQWSINQRQHQIPQMFTLASAKATNGYLVIRTAPNKAKAVQEHILAIWEDRYPTIPFQGGMLLTGGSYQTSLDLRNIFIFLTMMTVLLSCLGIYTLAALNVRQRLKEIGIRKVLGSSVLQVMKQLNREFVFILLISAIIGSFIAYWLLRFVNQGNLSVLFIDVSWEFLVGSAALLVLIGLATSSLIIAKGANQNPASILRDE